MMGSNVMGHRLDSVPGFDAPDVGQSDDAGVLLPQSSIQSKEVAKKGND